MLKATFLILLSSLAIANAFADQLDANGIMLHDSGGIHLMDHFEASGLNERGKRIKPDICQREFPGANMHLPNARDMARASQPLGFKVIMEFNEVSAGILPGYHPIEAIDENGAEDKFYFNEHAYKRQFRPDDLRQNFFWTSSLVKNTRDQAYIFVGTMGNLVPYLRSPIFGFAVRCIHSK